MPSTAFVPRDGIVHHSPWKPTVPPPETFEEGLVISPIHRQDTSPEDD